MMTAALVMALSVAAATPAPPLPRLCLAAPGSDIAAGQCTDAATKEITVEPAEKARTWMWIDSARRTVALGTLAPGSSKIVVDEKPSALLTISGSFDRGWPAATVVTVSNERRERWKFTVTRDVASSLHALSAPDGIYTLAFDAPRHLGASRPRLKLSHESPAQIGRIELKPVPMLRGRFIDRDGKGVADVAVTTPEGGPLATSDPAGYVHEELRAALPPRLFVRRSGFGHRNIDVTRIDADFDLGIVTLSPGSTLTINVDRNGYDGPLTASLIRPGEHTAGKRTTFETATVKGDVSRIELADIEARDYILLLRGDGPMQVFLTDVKVAEHENATKDVRIEPRSIKALVHKGSEPIAATDVSLTGGNGEWMTSIKTDDQGVFRAQAWDEGYVGVSVQPSPSSHYATSEKIGSTDAEWDISIPERTIRGIVVDKETSAPVPVKYLAFRIVKTVSGMGGLRSVPVGDDGRFQVDMVEAGKYTITANDPAYLDASVDVEVKPEDRDRDVRIEMEHGLNVRVKVVNADGAPVAGAMLIPPRSQRDAVQVWTTDAAGMATLVFRRSDPMPVWVVTSAEGFTFATISPDAKEDANTVILPRAAANVTVRTTHDDKSAAPHSHVFLAFNGVPVPDDVRSMFPYERLVTGSDGTTLLTHMPVGEYDFWARETPEERVMMPAPRFLGTPSHISALAGENSVIVVASTPKPRK